MSRLEFAPETDAMEVTDISTGHFVFTPLEGKMVAFEDLREAIEGAGYEIDRASIEVSGTVLENDHLRVSGTGQLFRLEGDREELEALRQKAGSDAEVTVAGGWRQEEEAQVITLEGESSDPGSGAPSG